MVKFEYLNESKGKRERKKKHRYREEMVVKQLETMIKILVSIKILVVWFYENINIGEIFL